MKAISYIRISTEDQSRYSLPSQERVIKEYCDRNGVDLVACFKDNGARSDTFDRPDYIALEKFIKKNKDVKYLIIYDHSRFARSIGEALMKIKELQNKHSIAVLTTTDAIDTDFTDPMNFMFRAFQFMQAEGQLHNIRKATRTGIIQAAIDGRFPNMAPYGYKNARDDRGNAALVIVDDQADIVRFIFRQYLAGLEIESIRRQAHEMGFKRRGNSAVQRILSNPVYCGLIAVPPHKNRKNKFSKGLHSPIISEQDYWLVQDKLHKRPNYTTHKNEEVPLRGVLHCWCGRKVTAGNSRSKSGKYHWYYLCPEHRQNLPATKLHRVFGELLDELSINKDQILELRQKLLGDIEEKLKSQETDIARVTRELKSLQLQIETAERKFLKGNVSEETYGKVIAELQGDQARHQLELAELNTNQIAYFGRLNTYLSGLENLRASFERQSIETQHQIVNLVFDNNLYYSNDFYRTPRLLHALSGNELELKEKGLLIVEKPSINLNKIPCVPGTGPVSNTLTELVELLKLIA